MNVSLLPEQTEPTAEPLRVSRMLSAAASTAPDEKTVAALLETAENEEQKRRVVRKICWWVYGLMLAAVGSSCFFAPSWSTTGQLMSGPLLFGVPTLISMVFPSGCYKPERQQNAVVALLKFPHEPRFLLPLTDFLHTPQTVETKSKIYPALIEALWNVPANDAALSLDNPRRAALRNVLSHPYGFMPNLKHGVRFPGYFDDGTADLAVAAMKTLAEIGDEKTVKILQKIINAEAKTANETVVRDAACEYLPILQKVRTGKEKVQNKLRACDDALNPAPEAALNDFLNTLSADAAKIALVDFIRKEQSNTVLFDVFASGTFGFLGLATALFGLGARPSPFVISVVLVLIGVGFHVLIASGSHFEKQSRRMAQKLVLRNESDPRLLSLLLDYAGGGAFFNGSEADAAVKEALTRLLPLLQPGDAALMPPLQRKVLCSWLKIPRRKTKTAQTLTIAALHAVAALGDTKALPKVEKIVRATQSEPGGTEPGDAELHAAALRCADILRARKLPLPG